LVQAQLGLRVSISGGRPESTYLLHLPGVIGTGRLNATFVSGGQSRVVEVTPLLVGCAAPYSVKMLHMKTNQCQSNSHRPMNPAIRCSLAAVALMLGACDQGEPPKGPSGTAGAAMQAPPSLIDRAVVFTKDATKTITEQATAAAVSAASQATGVTADSARSRSTALAEVTTAQAQQLIDQAKRTSGTADAYVL